MHVDRDGGGVKERWTTLSSSRSFGVGIYICGGQKTEDVMQLIWYVGTVAFP